MKDQKNINKIINQFQEDTGYTNHSNTSGIRKDLGMLDGEDDYEFIRPNKMLEDFIIYLKENNLIKEEPKFPLPTEIIDKY